MTCGQSCAYLKLYALHMPVLFWIQMLIICVSVLTTLSNVKIRTLASLQMRNYYVHVASVKEGAPISNELCQFIFYIEHRFEIHT